MTSQTSTFTPVAQTDAKLLERFRRTQVIRLLAKQGSMMRSAAGAVAGGIRLLRSAPPLGDIGTRGNDLTEWVDAWNRRGNPGDSSRE